MFHKTILGKFADVVSKYADRDGYVPERGDDWRDMNYGLGPDAPNPDDSEDERADKLEYLDEDWWPQHVESAVEATARASRLADEETEPGAGAGAIT